MMDLKDIIRDWLVTHKCDGLCNSDVECGCNLEDFMPCGELDMGCEAARQGKPPDGMESDFDFWMYPIAKDAGTDETPGKLLAEHGGDTKKAEVR